MALELLKTSTWFPFNKFYLGCIRQTESVKIREVELDGYGILQEFR